jgi:toxin ParE1/3/4
MTRRFEVFLTADAEQDLMELHDYIASHDAPAKAGLVLDRIEEKVLSLEHLPERGSYTKELLALGMREFREIYFKPYRIIYRVIGSAVYVYVIADGRRNMQTLLQRRVLEA